MEEPGEIRPGVRAPKKMGRASRSQGRQPSEGDIYVQKKKKERALWTEC